MKIFIPDNEPIEVANPLTIAEARRALELLGLTQVTGASASIDEAGDMHFERQTGGAKA